MQLDQIGPTDAMRRALNIQRGLKEIKKDGKTEWVDARMAAHPVKPFQIKTPASESDRERLRNTKGQRLMHGGREYITLRGVTFTCITNEHPEPPPGYKVFKYRKIPTESSMRTGECLPVAIKYGTTDQLRLLFEVWEAYGDFTYVWLDGDKEVKL